MDRPHNDSEPLFRAILTLGSVEECRAFFDDLCTIREIQDLSQRFAVAALLDQKKNYQEISRVTGASTATISRVNRCLHYGSGGYRTALHRNHKSDGENDRETTDKPKK